MNLLQKKHEQKNSDFLDIYAEKKTYINNVVQEPEPQKMIQAKKWAKKKDLFFQN